jgi:hypothetical protein
VKVVLSSMARRNDLEFKRRLAEIANRLDANQTKPVVEESAEPKAARGVPKKQPQRVVRDIMKEIKQELARKARKG